MDRLDDSMADKHELSALRALLTTHAAVGVDFCVDDADTSEPIATATLVWPAGNNDVDAPWIISERMVGRLQFKSLMRVLFLEGRATKVFHRISDAAHWMSTHGLASVLSAARNVVDLQLFYEHVVDQRTRKATLQQILTAVSGDDKTSATTQELYRALVSEQLAAKASDAITTTGLTAWHPSLTQTLLQHSVQRAHLCIVCMGRLITRFCRGSIGAKDRTTKAELCAFAQRRVLNASRMSPALELVWFVKKSLFAARSLELIVDDANAKATIPCVKRHCDIELLLALLPPSLYKSVIGIKRFEDRLVSISLNVGSKPKARVASEDQERTGTECVELHKSTIQALSDSSGGGSISHDELLGILAMVGGESAVDSTNCVGVDRLLHRITVVRSKSDQIVGITMRVGRTVQFASNIVLDLLLNPELRTRSVLVVGGSGAGKTSLLRDMARALSMGRERVFIVDTTNEIGGDGMVPHRSVDRATRFMVKSLEKNADTMVECVQNHIVDTLVVDEVTSDHDVRAMVFAKKHCRRRVIAGCAVLDLETLVKNNDLNGLVTSIEKASDHQQSSPTNDRSDSDDFVVPAKPTRIGDKKPSQSKRQRERVTFSVVDVIVELDAEQLGKCRIVWDVPRAVGDVLLGRAYAYETRIQSPDVFGIQVHDQVMRCTK